MRFYIAIDAGTCFNFSLYAYSTHEGGRVSGYPGPPSHPLNLLLWLVMLAQYIAKYSSAAIVRG